MDIKFKNNTVKYILVILSCWAGILDNRLKLFGWIEGMLVFSVLMGLVLTVLIKFTDLVELVDDDDDEN